MLIDYDLCYAILAAIIRQAVLDAKRGHRDAIDFLDYFFDEWRKFA